MSFVKRRLPTFCHGGSLTALPGLWRRVQDLSSAFIARQEVCHRMHDSSHTGEAIPYQPSSPGVLLGASEECSSKLSLACVCLTLC